MTAKSVFFGKTITSQVRGNASKELVAVYVNRAAWWMDCGYAELRGLMFGHTLRRSWFVLSSGSCPKCNNSVPLYNWLIDAKKESWKVRCPHCGEKFPTNDFESYYRSGLDQDGLFSEEQADSALLVGADGTGFGVDDGNGYYGDKGPPWLFIAAYLVHGHWKQLIIDGISALSLAYLVTGEADYARRAAIMLHRISEVFADFDFKTQGVMYDEEGTSSGYVTYWVNTCHDLLAMALGYDMICEAIDGDRDLETLLGTDAASIHQSIRRGIFTEALAHPEKYDSNPPDPAMVRIIMKTIEGWPANRADVLAEFDAMVHENTKIDGLVGEKGLASYAALAPVKVTDAVLLFSNIDEFTVTGLIDRYPALKKSYRFYIDTWYAHKHYPGCGDCGYFGAQFPRYLSTLPENHPPRPYLRGRDWFTWFLSKHYGDTDFQKALFVSYNGKVDDIFLGDIYLEDPQSFRDSLAKTIAVEGTEFSSGSVLYDQWRLAILRSGNGDRKRMVSMGYDSGANHCHHDALNINLFFYGLNLSPDFGYPPVNYGGWETKEVEWYRHPAAHNMVVIDGRSHTNLPTGKFLRYPEYGTTRLWHVGDFAQAVYADAREYAGVDRFERLVGLVDVAAEAGYVVDIFRVSGGDEHIKYFRTAPAHIKTEGLELSNSQPFGHKAFLRDFCTDKSPGPGWTASFVLGDTGVAVDYTDLTEQVSATICESWVDVTRMSAGKGGAGNKVIWIPTLMVCGTGPESTFVSVITPYQGVSPIASMRRLSMAEVSDVILEIKLKDGRTDYIFAGDPEYRRALNCAALPEAVESPFAVVRVAKGDVAARSISTY